ncbi:MAG: CotS family spore coat protein [Clostridiaceae bacterium]
MMREQEIERQFGIRIESIKPNKGVYLLHTNVGDKCLKKINYGVQKLLFVYGAKEHLIKNGFSNVDRYNLTIDGEIYGYVNEDLYTLSEWIDGREADFTNDNDLLLATEALAKIHEASKGFEPPENSKLKSDLGRWPHLMEKRVKSLDKMRDMARKKTLKSEFDIKYLKSYEEFKKLGIEAIKLLERSSYLELCNVAEEEKSFCHHDYTYHNIIIDKNNDINIIDFDYCKKEVRAYDISNFIIKVLKRVDWDFKYAKLILDNYNKISPISEEEHKVIFAFLTFPQRFWRLANRFYYNEVSWGHKIFERKINDLISEFDKYKQFIEDFKVEYNQNNE